MGKRQFPQPPGGPAVRQSALLQCVLADLQSPDAGTRAAAVRLLCPCRTAWDVPVQRYLAPMREDPSPTVRHEVHHVLDEDSNWGKRLAARRMKQELEAASNGAGPSPHSIAWRKRQRPRHQGHHRRSRYR